MELRECPAPDEPALIGVSGGRDSVALLHLLAARGHRLIVCHFDHALRPESRKDARFTADFAEQLGCACVFRRAKIPARSESAARDARYTFFAQVAKQRGVHRLFLAHHADDQVETLLLNLLRGSGASGLGAMRPVTARSVGGVELQIVRPLLGVWREEIDRYLATHGLAWREDASNADPQHTRNRVRHEILPALATSFGREVRLALWRSAELLREEDAFISAQPALAESPPVELSAAELKLLPLALQRRLLRLWLRAREVPAVGFAEVERVRGLLAGRGAKVNLPGNHHARRRAGRIFLEKPVAGPVE